MCIHSATDRKSLGRREEMCDARSLLSRSHCAALPRIYDWLDLMEWEGYYCTPSWWAVNYRLKVLMSMWKRKINPQDYRLCSVFLSWSQRTWWHTYRALFIFMLLECFELVREQTFRSSWHCTPNYHRKSDFSIYISSTRESNNLSF